MYKRQIKKDGRKAAYTTQRNSETDFPVIACCVSRWGNDWYVAVGARPGRAQVVKIKDEMCIRDRVWQLYKLQWVYAGAGLLILLVVWAAGNESFGAQLSLTIAGVSIQPSEFVKLDVYKRQVKGSAQGAGYSGRSALGYQGTGDPYRAA